KPKQSRDVIQNALICKPQRKQFCAQTFTRTNAQLGRYIRRFLLCSCDQQADLVPPHKLLIIDGCTIQKKDRRDTFLTKDWRNYVVYLSHSIVERQNEMLR